MLRETIWPNSSFSAMYGQWIGGPQIGIPMVQSDIAGGQYNVLENMAAHGSCHQGMWARAL